MQLRQNLSLQQELQNIMVQVAGELPRMLEHNGASAVNPVRSGIEPFRMLLLKYLK